MGWLDRWREARAEAAVRRQLAALEHERKLATHGGHLMPSVGVGHMPKVDTEPGPGGARIDVALAVNLPDLLAECARADKLAGSHGGFVTTARIREILRGAA